MGSYFGKVPAVESLSQKSKIFASSLWQGSLWGAHAKAPLAKGGCLGLPRRGDSVAKATDFFPIPSSLFPKKPSPFHMGRYFGKAPTVNPSVKNQRFLPAPTGREPLGCSDEAPLAKGGCLGLPRRGDSAGKACGTSYLFPKIARYRYRGINKAGTESVPAFWLWNFRSESSGSWR